MKHPTKFCAVCNHTGLIPFRNKHGELVVGAFIDCECKFPEVAGYEALTPEDIDYSCSSLWRAYYEETLLGTHLPSEMPIERSLPTENKEVPRQTPVKREPELHGGVNL